MTETPEQLKERYEKAFKELEKERAEVEEKKKQFIQQRQQIVSQSKGNVTAQQTGNHSDGRNLGERHQASVAGGIGNLKEFSLNEDWNHWVERFEQYYIANDIAPSKGVALFLTLIGSDGYALLRNLCTPVLPGTKTLNELNDIMKNHLQPKPSVIAER